MKEMGSYKDSRSGLIMVGPDPEGLGGISRVVRTWKEGNLFQYFNVRYVSSVSDHSGNKLRDLLRAVVSFLKASWKHRGYVYIHTASHNSFYRKSIFLLISMVLKKRVILHIHPAYFLVFLANFRGFKKLFFFSLLNRVHTFIVLTAGIKRDLQAIFPRKSIHVLSNPVALERMTNRHGIMRRKDRLLYLGWYNRLKGVYDLVDAAGMLVERGYNFQLDFYGTKETAELRDYVKSKRLEQVASVNGWADDEEKLKALYGSALLILPSHTEGIPNVILEAMATKTPIVSTHVGGLKEILVDGLNAVIAEPGNPVDLSRKIAYMLDNEEDRTKLAECAYREIKAKYDLPVIKEKFEQILSDIASGTSKMGDMTE